MTTTTINPVYTVGSWLRLPITARKWEVLKIDRRISDIWYQFDLLQRPFTAPKWYGQTELLALNSQPATVLPDPKWSNVLYHPTMTEKQQPRQMITNVTQLFSLTPVFVSAPIVTPWLADLRRARNLVYESTRGMCNGKTLLTIRLDLVEGQGIIAEAALAMPECANELALAVGEIAAARVMDNPYSVEFLSKHAGYRVETVIKAMIANKKLGAAA